jgi:hypothetical protein
MINIGDIVNDPAHYQPKKPYGIVIGLNETRTKAIILWLCASDDSWHPAWMPNITAVLEAGRLAIAGEVDL